MNAMQHHNKIKIIEKFSPLGPRGEPTNFYFVEWTPAHGQKNPNMHINVHVYAICNMTKKNFLLLEKE
jgi:hypothetical protein